MSFISFVLFGFVLVLAEHFVACNVLRETVSDEVEKRTVGVPVSWCHLNSRSGTRNLLCINEASSDLHKSIVVLLSADMGDVLNKVAYIYRYTGRETLGRAGVDLPDYFPLCPTCQKTFSVQTLHNSGCRRRRKKFGNESG